MDKVRRHAKHGAHFWLNCVSACLVVLAATAYYIGAEVFGYYDDLNITILLLMTASIIGAVTCAILPPKFGDKLYLSLVGLSVGVLLVACVMMIADARVYSIAVLLFSELERDNVEGYHALYSSLAAMGLLLGGVICNVASNFCGANHTKAE